MAKAEDVPFMMTMRPWRDGVEQAVNMSEGDKHSSIDCPSRKWSQRAQEKGLGHGENGKRVGEKTTEQDMMTESKDC